MASHMICTRDVHLEHTVHMFAYLQQYNQSRIVFDEMEPDFADTSTFVAADCAEFYSDIGEAITLNVPQTRGSSVITSAFIDEGHAGCKLIHCSGILIFVTRVPKFWLSKRQNIVKSSILDQSISQYIK